MPTLMQHPAQCETDRAAFEREGRVWARAALGESDLAPRDVLRRMLFVRIHLDDCGTEEGAMEMALGSHRLDIVAAGDAVWAAAALPHDHGGAGRGDLLLAKALILHRSGPSGSNARRRVLRLDYCAADLPAPLEWAAAAPASGRSQ